MKTDFQIHNTNDTDLEKGRKLKFTEYLLCARHVYGLNLIVTIIYDLSSIISIL